MSYKFCTAFLSCRSTDRKHASRCSLLAESAASGWNDTDNAVAEYLDGATENTPQEMIIGRYSSKR